MKRSISTWSCYQAGSNTSGTAVFTAPAPVVLVGIDFAAAVNTAVAADADKPAWITVWTGEVPGTWSNGQLSDGLIAAVFAAQRTNAADSISNGLNKFVSLEMEIPIRGRITVYFTVSSNQSLYSWTTLHYMRK